MGGQLWALSSRSVGACLNAIFRRYVLSTRPALFSRINGMKAGGHHVMERLINRRWLLEGNTQSSNEGTPMYFSRMKMTSIPAKTFV